MKDFVGIYENRFIHQLNVVPYLVIRQEQVFFR